ncbi:hypothetical protein LCGC14_0825720 [marine sediment metagenome]|uniref:Uncharacterized protein n=1 Tax=marine sediment metagenome TaxID=412755 RepID=A0A0F9S279_9ZZZZ
MNVKCYLIDDTCYYVTALQDLVLKKFHGAKKNKFIKKVSYTSGKLGEPVKSPDANNYLAVIYPEGYKPEVKAEEKVEAEKKVEETKTTTLPNPLTALANAELKEPETKDPLSNLLNV